MHAGCPDRKVFFVSSVSVEITKVDALNKDKTVVLSCFKLAYLIRGSSFGIRRFLTFGQLSLQLNSERGNLRRQKSGTLAIYILRVSTRLTVSDYLIYQVLCCSFVNDLSKISVGDTEAGWDWEL